MPQSSCEKDHYSSLHPYTHIDMSQSTSLENLRDKSQHKTSNESSDVEADLLPERDPNVVSILSRRTAAVLM